MDYQPSYGFLKDCLYRSESYKVTLADAYIEPARRRSVPFKMLQKRRPVEAKASTGVSS